MWLRARAGPVRTRLLEALDAVPLPRRALHPATGDETLFGGIDLGATLAAGRTVRAEGMLAQPALLLMSMAERCPPGLAARLGQALDTPRHCLLALDEGATPEEGLPAGLAERLALFVDLDAVGWSDTAPLDLDAEELAAARARLPAVTCPDDALGALTLAAARMSIVSLRAPLQAAAAARAAAALRGADIVGEEDLRLAAELVLAHRGTPPPEAEDAPPDDTPENAPEAPPDDPQEDRDDPPDGPSQRPPEEMLIEAALAALPPDLLAGLAAGRAARGAAASSGTGAARKGNRRGRPLPSRPGRLGSGARIDLVATLRAAAPWQPLRRARAATPHQLQIRSGDIRIRRYEERSDRVLIFAVDASGSAAMARLAEAKGAVELLLADAYARRDHVALVAFRGTGAEVLLPPTRSLVQTKRRLAALPGGGGTPLAAGLRAALALAESVRGKGMTPSIALLTDGRGNIALDGTPDRAAAASETARFAREIAAQATPTVVIDTGMRARPALQELAASMRARCLPLPRADARGLSAALKTALDAPGA